ncbi:MAG: Gfo/Idh/MocA family oxidoreductase [Chitinophagaceae bacterium]
MKEIKWGMIGCGNVTEKKSGAPAINKVPHSQLVAVMARNIDKAIDYAKRHNVPRCYDNVDALINDPEVNAVYIATPPDVHLEYTEKALKAGKPVYVEKPMARNFEECEEMNRISRETGVSLFVAFYRRTLPYFRQLKELIDQKVIGEPRVINIVLHWQAYAEEVGENPKPRWRVFPEISGGGHFHDLAPHQLDFLEYAFGPIKYATGIAKNQAHLYAADDIVIANFEFESGVLGNGSWCYTVNNEQRIDQCQIVGSMGKITFSFFEPVPIKVETADSIKEYHAPYPPHVQQPLLETIVSELRGEGKCPSTGETGARANWLMDRITKR